MNYPLVVFDFDGTLADSLPRLIKIFNGLADQYRFQKILVEEIETLRKLEFRQAMKRLRIPLWKVPLILRQVRKRMTSEADQIKLFPGIDEFLRRMTNQGVRLAIVSSNSRENIQRVLGEETAKLFEFAECNSSIFGKRPKLRTVIRKSGLTPARAIYIGDEVRDLLAARAEGLAFGAVTWGYTRLSAFMPHVPEEVFETVAEMSQKLSLPATQSTAEVPVARRPQ